MTEAEWLTSADAFAMLEWLDLQGPCQDCGRRVELTDRKVNLWACACLECKEGDFVGEPLFFEPHGYHKGHLGFRVTWKDCHGDSDNVYRDKSLAAQLLREVVGNPWRPVPVLTTIDGASRSNAVTVMISAPWFTPLVEQMAQAIYDELDFASLAILADALQDAGCPEAEECPHCAGEATRLVRGVGGEWSCANCDATGRVPNPLLAHLREPGPHVRGCFALDALLGKE